jgi:hypothetical protein
MGIRIVKTDRFMLWQLCKKKKQVEENQVLLERVTQPNAGFAGVRSGTLTIRISIHCRDS